VDKSWLSGFEIGAFGSVVRHRNPLVNNGEPSNPMVFRPEVLENPSVDFNKMYNLFNFTVAQYPRKVWTKSYEQFSRKSSLQIMEFQLVTQWSEVCKLEFFRKMWMKMDLRNDSADHFYIFYLYFFATGDRAQRVKNTICRGGFPKSAKWDWCIWIYIERISWILLRSTISFRFPLI